MEVIDLKKLFETIFYYIHVAPRLRRLFIQWSYLEHSERIIIDETMQMELQGSQIPLYNTLRDALQAWEHLQDTQGAPGFQVGSVHYNCDNETEQDLTYIMSQLEHYLNKMFNTSTVSLEEKQVGCIEEKPIDVLKASKPLACKSDSRLSRVKIKTKLRSERSRSSSGTTKKSVIFQVESNKISANNYFNEIYRYSGCQSD